jgi:hypothetical protein
LGLEAFGGLLTIDKNRKSTEDVGFDLQKVVLMDPD